MKLFITIMAIFLISSQSVTASGFILGDADPVLNNIWLEPKNPKPGQAVSIHSEIYNIGTESTMSVTDVVTIGYLINGDLIKIDPLVDVKPGLENGIHITSGPVWNAWNGEYTITVILDYHDTLSHITDDSANNIMQKVFRIGNYQNKDNLISFDIYQKFRPEIDRQEISIIGNIVLPDSLPKFPKPKMIIDINGIKYTSNIDASNGDFYFSEIFPVVNQTIPIVLSFDNERFSKFGYSSTKNLYPIKLTDNDSALVMRISNSSEYHSFKENDFTFVIYDSNYNILKKIDSNDKIEDLISYNTFPITLEEGKYNIETYFEGRLLYVTVVNLEQNKVVEKSIDIPESGKIKVQVVDKNNNPINDAQVKIDKHVQRTNHEGETNWFKVLPTIYKISEPYAVQITINNENIIWSEQFTIEAGEEKIITIIVE